MPERQPLTEIYPEELARVFLTLEEQIEEFLEGNGKRVVTLNTPAEVVKQCAEEIQSLAATIVGGIKDGGLDPVTLYLKTTQPARKVGKVVVGSPERVGLLAFGSHSYYILEKVDGPIGKSLLLLLQRIPYGVDTGGEVHGIKKGGSGGGDFIPSESGGIEVYVPLVHKLAIHVNDQVFRPKALEGLVTILPGDNHHHHIEDVGYGPTRVLILGGCGFGVGTKTDQSFEVPEFAEIPRFTSLG